MSVVRINAITVADGGGDELLRRFEHRAGEIEKVAGFESFELLRPDEGNTWYVYTRWASAEAFDDWTKSMAFTKGHAEAGKKPVAATSELLSYTVTLQAQAELGAEA